ncbi:MAG: hypothetical protein Q9157_002820, partial [Trypethelium eluteriae]
MGGLEPPPNPNDNRQLAILVNVCIDTPLAMVVVILRMITRIWVVRKVGWDDVCIVLCVLGHFIAMPIVIYEVHHGFGKHRQFISDQDFMNFTRLSYVEWVQTFQTLMFNKLSVCFFLLRLPASNPYKRPILGSIVGLIVSNVILTLVWIFQCWPVRKVWHPSIDGQCMTNAQLERIIISQALVSIISDFFLALFPVVLLWKVQMALRAKVGVCALMGLGLITAALCIARTVLNWENVNADPTWESIPNWGFRSWEISIGIIAACIPALRPGYRALSGQLSSFVSQHYGSATSRLNSRT